MYIGKNISYLRKKAKLSQELLAQKTDISKSSVSSYENGNSYPDANVILSLCAYFNTDPNTILLCDMEAAGLDSGGTVQISDLIAQQPAPTAPTNNEAHLHQRIKDLEAQLSDKNTIIDLLKKN